MADCGAYAPAIGIVGCVLGPDPGPRPHGRPRRDGPRHRVGVHRDAVGHRLGELLLHPDRHEDEAHVGGRGPAPADDRRGHPRDPGRRQPPRGRREAQEPPAARRSASPSARRRRPDPSSHAPQAARGARGARQRGVARRLRRHDDAADGDVPHDVRDLGPGPAEVQDLPGGLRGGAGQEHPPAAGRGRARRRARRATSRSARPRGRRIRRRARPPAPTHRPSRCCRPEGPQRDDRAQGRRSRRPWPRPACSPRCRSRWTRAA